MKKLILIPLFFLCISAFGQFTKPQLYSGINTNIRLKTASQTRLAAMLDSMVVSMELIGAGSMVYPGAGIPLSTGSAWGTSITAGTGVETALGVNIGTAGSFITNGGALGTPSSGTLTNATGLPVTGLTGSWSSLVSTLSGTAPFWKTSGTTNIVSASTILSSGLDKYASIFIDSTQLGFEQVDSTADVRSVLALNNSGFNFSSSNIGFNDITQISTEKDSVSLMYWDNDTGARNGLFIKNGFSDFYGDVFLKNKSAPSSETYALVIDDTGEVSSQAISGSTPITTEGDLIIGDSGGLPSALPIGASTYVLTSDGTTASWAAPSGGVSLSADNTWTGNNAFRNDVTTQSGTSYTVQASDEGTTIQFTNSGTVTVTLPDGLATNFNCSLEKWGTGDVVIQAATSLVPAYTTLTTQYTGAYVEHMGSNAWKAIGAFDSGSSTWGSITGTLSSQTDLQTALDAKLLKAGDTYTTTTGNGLALTTSTLTSGSLVDLASTGTAAASSTQKVLNVATSGANGTSGQTTYGGYFSNTHTGTTSTNVGLYAVASGGTTDRAIWAVGDLVVQNPLTGSNSRGLSVIDNGGTEKGFAKLVPSTDFRIGAGSGYPLYLYGGGTLSGALTTTGKWQVMDNPDNTSRAKLYVTHATGNTVPVLYTQSATRSSLTASTEVHENLFNQSITATFSTGALTTQRAFRITNPTYAFAGASTLTNAYSFYVDGAPVQGTNATITNSWAGGFGGPVKITGTSSGSALMLENSSGTEKVRYYDNGNYKNSQTNSTYFEKQMVGSTSATTYNEVLLTSSEISDGQSVRIEIMWTIKDTTANTSAGGTFVTTWSKASGTLVKAGDTELGTHDGVTGSWAVTSSDSSGSIQITWTGTAVNNSKISAFARILFNN